MNASSPDAEGQIRIRIAEIVGPKRFKVWFRNATRLSIADGILKVGVPNLFIGSWIENHFSDAINSAARDVLGRDVRVCYAIDPVLLRQLRKSQLNSQAEFVHKHADRGAREQGAGVNGDASAARPPLRFKLDDFVVGPANELAFTIARHVVERPGQAYNPVFFHGGCGLGKTHLLQGIANAYNGDGNGSRAIRWRYVPAEAFTNEFLLALKTGKLEAFRQRYRDLDALLIDDVHFLSNKRATQDEFLHTYNAVCGIGKQIVLASDAHPRMIGQLSESLVSRFVSGIVVRIDPPATEMRCEILRRRAAAIGRTVPEEVIAYVAEKIQTNVRELEGALLKLVATANVAKCELSVQMARHILDEHLVRTARILTVGDIESTTATYFGLTPADLHSSRKSRTIALARNVAMYLARRHTTLSLPEIARLMGNKNHTTVLLAHRKIDRMVELDLDAEWIAPSGPQVRKIREVVARIEEELKPHR
ncbi:MAG: chromosomal replication initiator protein DnaA [Phycisphaerae bacterium]|nr:chromosomal replication initiator protein DnaA [Phycisphaerae bacterium]